MLLIWHGCGASAKVPKVGSICKGILALSLQIQDYCPSYKGLQGLLGPCEDCKSSTYLVMILYSTTSNHLAMQGNYIYFLLLHRAGLFIGYCKGLAVPMDSQPQTGEAFQDFVLSDVHIQELNLESKWVARILPISYDLVKYHLPIQGNCIFVPPPYLHRVTHSLGIVRGWQSP